MKKKNGFTLVEILAAIVILSIIIAILVPVIGNIIDKVKLATLRNNAKALLEAGNIYYAKNMEEIEEPVEFKIFNGVQTGYDKLEFTGKVHTAYLMLLPDNRKAICVDNEKYSATKSVDEEDITIEEGICTGEWDDVTSSYLVSDESGGSFAELSIKSLPNKNALPNSGNTNDIIVITNTKISGYYVSAYAPSNPSNGMVWVVETPRSVYYLEAGNIRIGVSYAMQYEDGTWNLKEAYVYNDNEWKLLIYIDFSDGELNLENSNLGDIELTKEYDYTGEYQEYKALFPGYYTVELWGAQGGNASSILGGLGAYTKGDIYLNVGDIIYIYVGGTTTSPTGGWNGGGNGYNGSKTGRGGGGATDVRTVNTATKNTWNEFDSLKSRIMVAAGGGGGSYYDGNYYSFGGAAGGLSGYISAQRGGSGRPDSFQGIGATQSLPGYYHSNYSQYLGGFGYGGNSGDNAESEGGGGGGYYGGGGGYDIGAGGGGSSYISGHNGCSSIDNSSTVSKIIHTGNKYSSTGLYFINTQMIDGKGYEWTSINTSFQINQPTHDGLSTQVGNSGNGYAKVTLKSIESVDAEANKKYLNIPFNYYFAGTNLSSGNYQIFEAPEDGMYKMEAWGAQGGNASSILGGLGAYTKGEIYLNKGTKLYVYVGSQTQNVQTGGWNGGGNGYNGSYTGRGGGGATDIRYIGNDSWSAFDSLKSRIMVAAGGGGGSYYNGNYYSFGGAAGGLSGYISAQRGSSGRPDSYQGTGAAQTLGGYYNNNVTQYKGIFGIGGNSGDNVESEGGGGGGYYGGGGGYDIGAGGGGSSYISGFDGCSSIDLASSTSSTETIHTGSSYHQSGYYFINTKMIDGRGMNWSSSGAVSQELQPTPGGNSSQTGNSGNGYAKITLISRQNEMSSEKVISPFNFYFTGTTAFDGRYQIFDVPKTGYYKFKLWGAQGGTASSAQGGFGGYTEGEIHLNKGTKLYIFVGSTTNSPTGGWNGGGNGYNGSYTGRGGGGSTDVRTTPAAINNVWNDGDSLKTRIMVAAGGGGASLYSGAYYSYGGAGGGLTGYMSAQRGSSGRPDSYQGTGGTQVAGGAYYSNASQYVGSFGSGGNSGNHNESEGGGGSGWYGGGGGYDIGAGGGGSSYISGHAGCIAVTSDGSPKVDAYSQISDSFSYTGYRFTNTQMIDGQGYIWSTEKSALNSGMPNKEETNTVTGNSGNGYAKIIYLGE